MRTMRAIPLIRRFCFGIFLLLLICAGMALICPARADGARVTLSTPKNSGSLIRMSPEGVLIRYDEVSSFSGNEHSCTLVLKGDAAGKGLNKGKEFVYLDKTLKTWFLKVDSLNGSTVHASTSFESVNSAANGTDLVQAYLMELWEKLYSMLGPDGKWEENYVGKNYVNLNTGVNKIKGWLSSGIRFEAEIQQNGDIKYRAEIICDFEELYLDASINGSYEFNILEVPLTPAGTVGPKLSVGIFLSGSGSGGYEDAYFYNTYVIECFISPEGKFRLNDNPDLPNRGENRFSSLYGELDLTLGVSTGVTLFDFLLSASVSLQPGIRFMVKCCGDEGGNPGENKTAPDFVETWHYCRVGECVYGGLQFRNSFDISLSVSIGNVSVTLADWDQPIFSLGILSFYSSRTFRTKEFKVELNPKFFDDEIVNPCPYQAHRVNVTVKDADTKEILRNASVYLISLDTFDPARMKDRYQYDDKVLYNSQNKTGDSGTASLFIPAGSRTVKASAAVSTGGMVVGAETFTMEDSRKDVTIYIKHGELTVKFNKNTEAEVRYLPEDQSGYAGAPLQLWGWNESGVYARPATPGYQFVGWSPDPDASPDSPGLLTGTYDQFTDSTTLYAVWRRAATVRFFDFYGMIYQAYYNVPIDTLLAKYLQYGIPVYAMGHMDDRYNYSFDHWEPDPHQPITGDIDFFPVFNKSLRYYNVYWFNGDELLQMNSWPLDAVPEYGGDTPVKDPDGNLHYLFSGWSPAVGPVTTAYQAYHAQFTEYKEELSVTFDCGGGSPVPPGQVVRYGSAAVRPETDPKRTGYIFDGWMYRSREYDFSLPVYDDITITAAWLPVEYTFTSGDGKSWQRGSNTGLTFTVSRNYEDETTLSHLSEVRINGELLEEVRYSAAAGSLKLYIYPGTLESLDSGTHTLTVVFDDGEAEATFYTGFDPRRFYRISWINEDGSILEEDEMVPEGSIPAYNGPVPQKDPTATESFVFAGWTPEIVPAAGNASYRAVYAMHTDGFKVAFEAEGGSPVPAVQIVPSGGTADVPDPEPEKTGYEFDGWQLNENAYDFSQPVLFDLTLQAAWIPVTYEVVYGDGQTWQKGTNGGLSFRAVRDPKPEKAWPLMQGVRVDGNRLNSVDWDASPGYGDVTVMLRPNLLESLETGYHRLTLNFADGEAEASFLVNLETRKTWKVYWVNEDGTLLEFDEMVPEGTMPKYNSPTPRKEPSVSETYMFAGWMPEPVPVTMDMVYTARFVSQPGSTLTVTFEAGGGSPVPPVQAVYPGQTAARPVPDPEMDGREFVSWQLDGKDYDFSLPVTADLTLTALWKELPPDLFTILWLNDDGTLLERDENVPAGTMAHYNGATPQKAPTASETYVFAGWTPEPAPVTKDAEYRAAFNVKPAHTFSVTFEAGGGSPVPPVQVLYAGQTARRPVPDPEMDGWEFVSWQLNGEDYDFSKPVNADLTLAARWKKPAGLYTVLWINEDGTVLERDENLPEGAMARYNGSTPQKAPTASETYVFAGWMPEPVPVTTDAVYRAVFRIQPANTLTVTFEAGGGSPVPPVQILSAGQKARRPVPDPEMEGWIFVCWQLNGKDYDFSLPVNADLTLTARWKEAPAERYTVLWIHEDGTLLEREKNVPAGTVPVYDGPVPHKAETEAETYTFIGWNPQPASIRADMAYRAMFRADPKVKPVPLTGDGSRPLLWLLCLLGGAALLAAVLPHRKKQ